MPKLIILGSSNAVPDEEHENAHMAVVGEDRFLLIDCPGNPLVRLQKAGLEPDRLSDLILTHFHPDHVSGVALLLMDLWLLGRTRPLRISGLAHTLDRFEQLMDMHGWDTWPRFFEVQLNRVPEKEMTPVLEDQEWRVFASPVAHLIPNLGLRVEFLREHKALAYSCDTEPCPQVVRLARGADVLIHEAAGAAQGHTDAAQAGGVALEAGAKRLLLIHYPTGRFKDEEMLTRAQAAFQGPVALAEDFMEIDF